MSNAAKAVRIGTMINATGGHTVERSQIGERLESIFRVFPVLRDRRPQIAGTLSGGEQQMLAIGRALMTRPRLLLLDEPSLGLAPMLAREIFRVIRRINQDGVAVLLVEQNARRALALASRGYVLETGRLVTSGTSAELSADPRVRTAYLGLDRARSRGELTRATGEHELFTTTRPRTKS